MEKYCYIIVSAGGMSGLSENVSRKMHEGWVCAGGVSVVQDRGAKEYFQAMIKTTVSNEISPTITASNS